ncbi:hypothetical protein [Streptomyces sp. NPDC054887]
MRRHGLTHGRRGAAMGATAVVLCLGGILTTCGGGSGDDGYVAVGAAGSGPERAPGRAVPPQGEVELVPLDGKRAPGGGRAGPGGEGPPGGDRGAGDTEGTGAAGGGGSATRQPPGRDDVPGTDGPDAPRTPGAPGGGEDGGDGGDGDSGGGHSGGGGGTSTKPPATGTPVPPGSGSGGTPPAPPPGPAVLVVGDPLLAPGGERWCERVTVPLRNTGGSAVRSGTVTFATHIIGALGVDWGTRTSSQPLPGPIAAGAAVTKTYTVCVDAWRVPLGMRVETQDVTAAWR